VNQLFFFVLHFFFFIKTFLGDNLTGILLDFFSPGFGDCLWNKCLKIKGIKRDLFVKDPIVMHG